MPCTLNKPGCPGPYSLESCDTCATLEGEKCLRTPPGKEFKTGRPCGGPFSSGFRCQICKTAVQGGSKEAWEALVVDRRDKRKWLATLKSLQVREVYDADVCVDITPADIDGQYNKDMESGKSYDWCPWVKIGNLYTTVTTGNDAGWRLLEKYLQPDPKMPRAISVFTGRHGNPEGTITKRGDRELFFDGVMDSNHYLQDILQKVVAEGTSRAGLSTSGRASNYGTSAPPPARR